MIDYNILYHRFSSFIYAEILRTTANIRVSIILKIVPGEKFCDDLNLIEWTVDFK